MPETPLTRQSQKKDDVLVATTDRKVEDYITELNIPREELLNPNNLILDLGSGIDQDLSKSMKKPYRAKIVSLDPSLAISKTEIETFKPSSLLRIIRGSHNWKPAKRSLAALGENLPFQDKTFNSVYCLYSVPFYLMSSNPILEKQTMQEIIRVLKPNGTARIYPFKEQQFQELKEYVKDDIIVKLLPGYDRNQKAKKLLNVQRV